MEFKICFDPFVQPPLGGTFHVTQRLAEDPQQVGAILHEAQGLFREYFEGSPDSEDVPDLTRVERSNGQAAAVTKGHEPFLLKLPQGLSRTEAPGERPVDGKSRGICVYFTCVCYRRSGNSTCKVVPSSPVASTEIMPPAPTTISRASESPMPVLRALPSCPVPPRA